MDEARLIICQSNAETQHLKELYPDAEINPLGDWTGGTMVDAGATDRKLGSDMADSVTGGGLHGKEPLARRLIEKITVYDEKLLIEFKSGLTVEVEA